LLPLLLAVPRLTLLALLQELLVEALVVQAVEEVLEAEALLANQDIGDVSHESN
jgi:hypothetical protein